MQVLSSSPRIKSLLEQAVAPPKKQIFVVMQFGNDELDSAYTGVIKPVGESFGFNVVRVDEIQDGGSINQQMLGELSSSAIVLADLSGERPNCYYEAGFAHAIGKEMIFSIRHGSTIHFDLAGNRFITWATEAEYRRKLKERLESITTKGGA
jgi:nucleoside 2-deoxyribosyltransferase